MAEPIRSWLTARWNYFNTSPEGLHHVAHFFIAGWVVFLFGAWEAVLVLAFSIELYDIYKDAKYYPFTINWRDHFWDLCSWMIGALFWSLLMVPLSHWF